MCSPGPIERTIASELGCTGSLSTLRFQWLSAGKTGLPASTAAPMATLPYKSAGLARRAEAARLALRQAAVAAHVAVLAARDEVHRRLVADVLDLPHRRGVHAGEPARAEQVLRLVVQANPDPAAVDEVELLLLVVEVAAGLEARRDLDRVDAEGRDAELAAHLAEARALGERVDVRDGVAIALHDLVNLVSHEWELRQRAPRSGGRRAPRGGRRRRAAPRPRTPAVPSSDRRRGSRDRPRASASPGSRTPPPGPSRSAGRRAPRRARGTAAGMRASGSPGRPAWCAIASPRRSRTAGRTRSSGAPACRGRSGRCRSRGSRGPRRGPRA